MSPKENRTLPPLDYERVYRLKQDFPALHIGINGGIESLISCTEHLKLLDSVMMGRAAYHNPALLLHVDAQFYGGTETSRTREAVLQAYVGYVKAQLELGVALTVLIRPILGLFHEIPGAKGFRRYLSEHAHQAGVGVEMIEMALERVRVGPPHENGENLITQGSHYYMPFTITQE